MNRCHWVLLSILFMWACSPSQAVKSQGADSAAAANATKAVQSDSKQIPETQNSSPAPNNIVAASALSSGQKNNAPEIEPPKKANGEPNKDAWLKPYMVKELKPDDFLPYAPVAAVWQKDDTAIWSIDRNGYITRWDLTTQPVSSIHLNSGLVNRDKLDLPLRSACELRLHGSPNYGYEYFSVHSLPSTCRTFDKEQLSGINEGLQSSSKTKGKATTAVVDADNQHLAVATSHGHVFIWNLENFQLLNNTQSDGAEDDYAQLESAATILGPTLKAVSHMVFGTNGLLLAGYFNGQVIVWNVKRKKKVHNFKMTDGYPEKVAISPDGKWVAAGGTDGSLWLWDVTGEHKAIMKPKAHSYLVTGLKFSAHKGMLLSASSDGTFAIWQLPKTTQDELVHVNAWGTKLGPDHSAPLKSACDIVEFEMEKALFYLFPQDRQYVSTAIFNKHDGSDNEDEWKSLLHCHKNANGSAWGIIPHDVVMYQEAKAWLLYVDSKGRKTFGGRHGTWSGGNYGLALGPHRYFDVDGDGIDEVMWTEINWDKEDYSTDGGGDTVVTRTFKKGRIVNAKLKYHAQSVSDVNGDDVLDLVIEPFFAVTMSSCGHSLEATHPVGPFIVAFGSSKREFSTSGKQAAKYYRKRCPKDESISSGVKKGDVFDNEKLRNNIVCRVLWGHSTSSIQSEIKSLCQDHRIESDCMDSVWFESGQTGCVGMDHLLEIATAKAPLVLK